MLYEFITQGCCTFAARPHRSFVAFRPFGEVSSVIRGSVFVFDTPPSQASPLVGVSNTPTPLRRKFPHVSQSVVASKAGSAASVLEPAPGPHQARTRPAPGPHQARTRPAPGPRQGFFSDVTQFDLTDFAGQKRDLRTMEPVAGEIGHCFVVGARHQLRASMSAGWRGSAG